MNFILFSLLYVFKKNLVKHVSEMVKLVENGKIRQKDYKYLES